MSLSEAEIQVLASLRRTELEGELANKATLEESRHRYWIFAVDWSDAYSSLVDKGLIQGDERCYKLTETGRPLAVTYHAERPDHFWYYYQHFYPRAHASQAHSRLCEMVFGEDHCQEGQTDMTSFNDLLQHLDIKPGDSLLDLGCGAGGLSEYAADQTGAKVTGIDYSASAIETAKTRTAGKRDRLTFLQADMNNLALPPRSFHAAFSLDTIYWVADIREALASFIRLIKPGGRLGIFIAHTLEDCNKPEELEADATWVASALSELNLRYQVYDYTKAFRYFWPRMKQGVQELRDDFSEEGNEFICAALLKDADAEYIPAGDRGELRRYLYIVDAP